MSNNDNDHLDATYNRIKANGFFLMGSIFYLPPTIADVIAGSDQENSSKPWYRFVLVGGMLLFLANGIFETHIAYKAYKQQQANVVISSQLQEQETQDLPSSNTNTSTVTHQQPYQGDIINGCLFALAAFLELLSTSFWSYTLLTLSGLSYLTNALLTLYLRRIEAREADSPLTKADNLVRFGDLLFLVGCILDLGTTFREGSGDAIDKDTMQLIVKLSLASSILWFSDAILYLIADKIVLDHGSNSSIELKSGSNLSPMV